jgi:hypothetical protein
MRIVRIIVAISISLLFIFVVALVFITVALPTLICSPKSNSHYCKSMHIYDQEPECLNYKKQYEDYPEAYNPSNYTIRYCYENFQIKIK